MQLPLSRIEISNFMEISIYTIEMAWRDGRLQKSLFADGRNNYYLAQSTIFDAIEFRLSYAGGPYQISREHSAIWVSYLCEVSELSSWQSMTPKDRQSQLLGAAIEDGLCQTNDTMAHAIVESMVSWQEQLLLTCYLNDYREKSSQATDLSVKPPYFAQ